MARTLAALHGNVGDTCRLRNAACPRCSIVRYSDREAQLHGVLACKLGANQGRAMQGREPSAVSAAVQEVTFASLASKTRGGPASRVPHVEIVEVLLRTADDECSVAATEHDRSNCSDKRRCGQRTWQGRRRCLATDDLTAGTLPLLGATRPAASTEPAAAASCNACNVGAGRLLEVPAPRSFPWTC